MKRWLLTMAMGAALGAVSAQAQQVTIRWGDVVGGTHPSVQMIDRIAAEAKEKSGGRIVIQSFPGGQLGGSRDMIDAVANGAQQVVTEGAANFGAWVPSISVVEAPYLWRDAAHLDKAMNGPIGEQFNETLVKARGMRILGTTYYGTRHITTTSKEVRSPADMGTCRATASPTPGCRARRWPSWPASSAASSMPSRCRARTWSAIRWAARSRPGSRSTRRRAWPR